MGVLKPRLVEISTGEYVHPGVGEPGSFIDLETVKGGRPTVWAYLKRYGRLRPFLIFQIVYRLQEESRTGGTER